MYRNLAWEIRCSNCHAFVDGSNGIPIDEGYEEEVTCEECGYTGIIDAE